MTGDDLSGLMVLGLIGWGIWRVVGGAIAKQSQLQDMGEHVATLDPREINPNSLPLGDELFRYWDFNQPSDPVEAVGYWHDRTAWVGVQDRRGFFTQRADMRLASAVMESTRGKP